VLAVTAPALQSPTFVKSFDETWINEGDRTILNFAISNPNSITLTGIAFTDSLPSGFLIDYFHVQNNTCGGTLEADQYTNIVSLSAGVLSPTSSCTVSVSVLAVIQGEQTNPSVTLTSNEAPAAISDSVTVFVQPWWLAFFH
jgi:uncharacterized repeat protein (TIGR01451 family)